MQAPGEEVIFDPQLPPGWNSLAFAIQWRGQRVRIEIRDSALGSALELDVGAPGPAPEMPITFQVGAQRLTVERAGRYRTEGSRGVWSPWNRQSP
jgi:trehalose/maltose hydrolase-like predicted phosphorylase